MLDFILFELGCKPVLFLPLIAIKAAFFFIQMYFISFFQFLFMYTEFLPFEDCILISTNSQLFYLLLLRFLSFLLIHHLVEVLIYSFHIYYTYINLILVILIFHAYVLF